MLGENEFICNDSLFKVLPQTAIQCGGCSFTERERERESSLKTLTGEGAKGERGGEGTGEGESEGESVYESESAAEDEGRKDGRCMRRQNEGGRKTRM